MTTETTTTIEAADTDLVDLAVREGQRWAQAEGATRAQEQSFAGGCHRGLQLGVQAAARMWERGRLEGARETAEKAAAIDMPTAALVAAVAQAAASAPRTDVRPTETRADAPPPEVDVRVRELPPPPRMIRRVVRDENGAIVAVTEEPV